MTVLNEYARQVHVSQMRQVLETYDFPAGLLARVQQEQGWTEAFTLGAAAEYRRFVILAATSPHPVTPSQIVDGVWHTHLMFTRDYWERLTPLLPAPLHHEPGTGAPGDGAHFAAQYLQTLDTYRQTFGTQPPAEFWPDPGRVPPVVSASAQPLHAGRANWKLLVSAFVAGAAYLMSHALAFAVLAFVAVLVFTTLASALAGRRSLGGSSGGDSSMYSMYSYTSGDDGHPAGSDPSCTPDSGGSGSGDSGGCGDSGGSSCGSSCGGGGCGSS